MANNTKMKEIQGELKSVSEALGLHHDRFMQWINDLRRLISICRSCISYSWNLKTTLQYSLPLQFPILALWSWIFHGSLVMMQWLGHTRLKSFSHYTTLLMSRKWTIAFIYFEGKVLQWFQLLEKAHQVPDWLSLSTAI